MRNTVARTFVLVLALLAFLFTVDAARKSDLSASFLTAIALVALGYVALMLHLAKNVLHGSPRERHTAATAIDVASALPLVVLIPAIPLVGGADVAAAAIAATAWFLCVVLWTWLATSMRETARA